MRYLFLVREADVPDRAPTPDVEDRVRRHDAVHPFWPTGGDGTA
jgi:hypothetical protein